MKFEACCWVYFALRMLSRFEFRMRHCGEPEVMILRKTLLF